MAKENLMKRSGKALYERAKVPTRIALTTGALFTRYGAEAAQELESSLEIPEWKRILGNTFYNCLDKIQQYKMDFLNTLDKIKDFDKYQQVGTGLLGIAAGLWVTAGIRKLTERVFNIQGERGKDFIEGLGYGTAAAATTALTDISNMHSGDLSIRTLEGLVTSVPNTINDLINQNTTEDLFINAFVATLAIKGLYKIGKSIISPGKRYN